MAFSARDLSRFLAVSTITAGSVMALNFIIDPLQVFRPATLYPPLYSSDSRVQGAGLIRTQEYDTVLMGTSLAVHFRQSDLDKKLGGRSLKLAASGSNSVEQSFILDASLKRNVKRVVWQLDEWIFRDAPDIDSDRYTPADLYRMNVRGISGYLLSLDTGRESLWILLRYLPPLRSIVRFLTSVGYLKYHIENVDEINTLPNYFNISKHYNAANARASFKKIVTGPTGLSMGSSYEALVKNFERDAISLIDNHPDVEFDIYFPPYSILLFVAVRDTSPTTLELAYQFGAYMNQRMSGLPNVRVFDFRNVKGITYDLENYLDLMHHSPIVDLKIIEMIAVGKNRLDSSYPNAHLDDLKKQVEEYRVD
jgi:hypothetical protein